MMKLSKYSVMFFFYINETLKTFAAPVRVLVLFEPLLCLFVGFPVESSPQVRLPCKDIHKYIYTGLVHDTILEENPKNLAFSVHLLYTYDTNINTTM